MQNLKVAMLGILGVFTAATAIGADARILEQESEKEKAILEAVIACIKNKSSGTFEYEDLKISIQITGKAVKEALEPAVYKTSFESVFGYRIFCEFEPGPFS